MVFLFLKFQNRHPKSKIWLQSCQSSSNHRFPLKPLASHLKKRPPWALPRTYTQPGYTKTTSHMRRFLHIETSHPCASFLMTTTSVSARGDCRWVSLQHHSPGGRGAGAGAGRRMPAFHLNQQQLQPPLDYKHCRGCSHITGSSLWIYCSPGTQWTALIYRQTRQRRSAEENQQPLWQNLHLKNMGLKSVGAPLSALMASASPLVSESSIVWVGSCCVRSMYMRVWEL